MGKRKRVATITLSSSSDSNNSDSDFEILPSSSTSAYPSSSSSTKKLSRLQQFSQSPFLAPRSKLFGGKGTGVDERPSITLKKARSTDDDKKDVKITDSPKRRRQSTLFTDATLDGMLEVEGGTAISAEEQLEELEYGEGALLLTTPSATKGRKKGDSKKKGGRKKGKGGGKGKKKDESGDSSSHEDSSDADSERSHGDEPVEPVNFDNIVGDDPDKTVVRALISSPHPQVSWLINRFATLKWPKPREEKIVPAKKKQKKNDSDDEAAKKKARKPATRTQTRIYANKIPLFLLVGEDVEEKVKTSLAIHQPVVEIGEKKGTLGAKFTLVRLRALFRLPRFH
jgi:hypothetical protein